MKLFAAKPTVFILMILNLGLAGAIVAIEPDKWMVLPLGGLLLPILYIGILLARARFACACVSMSEIHEHLAMAALLLTSALGITLTNLTGLSDGTLNDRFTGAMLGMLIVFFGNRLPKEAKGGCDGSDRTGRAQRIQRRSGYVMVLAGVLMVASWMVFPVAVAEVVFIGIGVLMLLVILGLASDLMRSHETISG